MGFVEYIEKQTRFIRYNPFKYKFDANPCFLQAYEFYNESIDKFKEFIEDPSILERFIPDKPIHIHLRPDYATKEEIIEEYFKKIQCVVGETIFTREDGEMILKDLNELLRSASKSPKEYTQLKSLLKIFGYDREQVGKAERGKFKIITLNKQREKV
jgi:hypothetical protein